MHALKKMRPSQYIPAPPRRHFGWRLGYLLWLCLGCIQSVAAPLHEQGAPGGQGARPNQEAEATQVQCAASPQRLADFANGESFDYGNLVVFLTTDSCGRMASAMGRDAIRRGVSFNEKAPFRLDLFATGTQKQDLNAREQADAALSERIPGLLRQNPLSADELLPLTGQLALLSPTASRSALVYMAQDQLQMAAPLIGKNTRQSEEAAKRVASSLVRLGMDREIMSEQFARQVEEMAVFAQADSLSKIFKSLAAAAKVNRSLASTYNLSAAALNNGVKKNNEMLSEEGRGSLLKAVFAATQNAVGSEELFRPALAELNEAALALAQGKSLNETSLKAVWSEVLSVLAENNSQTILADALALSLTPEVIFLPGEHRRLLGLAAKNYRQVGIAVQDNYLTAFHKLLSNYQNKKIDKGYFEGARNQFLSPWAETLIELGPGALTRRWLKQVVQFGLLSDSALEARFPLLVLEQLRRSEEASAQARQENAVEVKAASLAENMASLWTLSRIHIPALQDLVKRQP